MHYNDLYIAHRAFYAIERIAYLYTQYMEQKDWRKWIDSVPIDEVLKLFKFIRRWRTRGFAGDPEKFQRIYEKNFLIIKDLGRERLEDMDSTDDELLRKIEKVFDEVTRCSWRYESTGSSKILHTILPHLFVMWDRKIRKGILGYVDRNWGAVYASEFLPKMRNKLEEAIQTTMQENKLSRKEAIRYIRKMCYGETLPKLIDEYNYMIYTRSKDFKQYIKRLKKRGEITTEEYVRLMERISS